MYALNFVRKRQRRLVVAIIAGVGLTGVTTLSIAAFLGQRVGSFTVSLEAKDVKLSLSETSDFRDPTSFLRVQEIPEFHEFTYRDFKYYYGDDVIDSEQTDYSLGVIKDEKGDPLNTDFLKYTFFIKNVGAEAAVYNFSLVIKDMTASEDGRTLESSYRVMIYDNGESEVYARKLDVPRVDEDKHKDYRAPISVDKDEGSEDYPFEGYAETFEDSKTVVTKRNVPLQPGEVRRYTVVSWLEGFRSKEDAAPKGATIKLGVEIKAYEN